MKSKLILISIIFLFSIHFTSCKIHKITKKNKDFDKNQIKNWAIKIKNMKKKSVNIKGKFIKLDCSNYVKAVYLASTGKDLFDEAIKSGIYEKIKKSKKFGRRFGVVMLYVLFRHKYNVSKVPQIGDIIFFDNTYDKNRNKIYDDPLTHTGIVVDIDSNNTVKFIHAGTSKGIDTSYLNMSHPSIYKKNGKILNSFLKRKKYWDKTNKRMAGQLVKSFGRL